ncbi:glycoside hydrolase family 3 protein, partial [Cadophora sp. DSE1049]
ELLKRMTAEQKVTLLAGKSYWRTASIPELGIKALKFSDGPNGCRGESVHAPTHAYCFPCGSCVGATFNADLVFDMGVAIGKDCKTKSAGVILGPTINLHRSPLGGRNFESFSEDPTLSGLLAAAYINGVQSQNIVATPKHFLGNECEKFRRTSNSIIDERTMRELYAYPFQVALKLSMPKAIMASYNKVNGVSMSQNKEILQGLLREEWNWDGVIMSDFEGTYAQNEPIEAGLNLEMPGPSIHRGEALIQDIKTKKVSENQIDFLLGNVLKLIQDYGMDDEDAPETVGKDQKTEILIRQIAAEGIVLLRNQHSTLPLKPASSPKIAVFGSLAKSPTIHGGGSASVTPSYTISPLEAIQERYGISNVTFNAGVPIFMKIPSAPLANMRKTSDGAPGVDCYWYNGSTFGENLILHETLEKTTTVVIYERIVGLERRHCTRMSFILTPTTSGSHTFGITANGLTKLFVDGVHTLQHEGFDHTEVEYIMQPGRFEVCAEIVMQGGKDYTIVIDTLSTIAPPPPLPSFQIPAQATQVGFFENLNAPASDEIVKLAEQSDISLVFVGNNKEYESESFDRTSLSLSAPQDNLINTVSSASKKTVVVNMSGSPISMPWLESTEAVLQCWFAGQEVGNAVADILSGDVNPSAKLPVSFPTRIEDSPSYSNFPTDDNHELRYAEGLAMGYRARDGPKPLFPFGFGLSYTEFTASDLKLPSGSSTDAIVTLKLANTGSVRGQQVVQLYVDGVLKAFSKPMLEAGEAKVVTLKLDKYAFSYWDTAARAW